MSLCVLAWVFFASPDQVKMLKTPRRREGVFQKGKGPMLDPESTLTGSETRDWYKTPSLCQGLVYSTIFKPPVLAAAKTSSLPVEFQAEPVLRRQGF